MIICLDKTYYSCRQYHYYIHKRFILIYIISYVLDIMYSLYFDGACRGNPGTGGYGAVLYDENNEIIDTCYSRLLHTCTNNQAEYAGLLNGLRMVVRNNIDSVNVYGDSKLIVEQLNGRWKVKSDALRVYYDACKEVISNMDIITFTHVKRNLNKYADMLANRALDE